VTATNIALIMLAAGNSTRMGGPNKLLMAWRGKPLIQSSVAAYADAAFTRKIFVTGRDAPDVMLAARIDDDWQTIHNHIATTGLASSLKLGLSALAHPEIALVALGDMPDVSRDVIAALVAAWVPNAYAIVPTYQKTWGNPVILGAAAIADCAALTGDRGARALLVARAGDCLEVETACPGILFDLDTAAAFGN
jgi:molybdenum cofactor cytidylyltransferase